MSAGIMHLSAVNHHISTILDMSASRGGSSGWHLPRQASAAAAGITTGISSFAFQGTNAHALLQQHTVAATAATRSALVTWSRQRAWVAPPTHALLQSASVVSGQPRRQQHVSLEAALATPQLAFLWEHRVKGLVMLPATAFVEMAVGSQRVLLNSNDLAASSLKGSAFVIPMTLAPGSLPPPKVSCWLKVTCGW